MYRISLKFRVNGSVITTPSFIIENFSVIEDCINDTIRDYEENEDVDFLGVIIEFN